MKLPRFSALLLSLTLALTLVSPAAAYSKDNLVPQQKSTAPAFADTVGTWCGNAVRTCYEAGLLEGKTADRFAPRESLTYAQITVITARLHELLSGGDGAFPAPAEGAAWYQPAADYLAAILAEETGDTADYLLTGLALLAENGADPCDRYDFAWYLSAVLPESALTPINTIAALPDTDDADILRLYNAGILTGSDSYGTFRGMDPLNRGQAAAMLARVIAPSQRVKFTPQTLVMSQAVLGLAPETTVLTVNGRAISAELYTHALLENIADMELSHYFSLYETYPDEFAAYLSDSTFQGSFGDYLAEVKGISADAPIDWNAPDKGGMSPAQKVRENTLADVTWLAVLLDHEKDYPLTEQQKASLGSIPIHGFSVQMARTLDTASWIDENLTNSFSLTAKEINAYLEQDGCIYGRCAVLYRDGVGLYDSDAAAKEAAETVRSQMTAHRDDSEYLEYLLWKYSEEDSTEPTILSLEQLSLESRQTLQRLGMGQVSPVLTEEDRYVVVLKLDPSKDEAITQSAASIPAAMQIEQWTKAAQTATSAVYDTVDVAKAADAYGKLFG